MKQNIVVYLAKENTDLNDIVDKSSRPRMIQVNEDGFTGELYLKKTISEPSWLSLFNTTNIPNGYDKQKSIKGLLVLHINDRYLLITFGHGRSLINLNKIVRGFGLRVAMNIGDPKQLKSIDKSKLDQVALKTRSQSSTNTGLEQFDFEFDHEIMKSMTAIVDNDEDELEIISGADSVSLYTDISPTNLTRQAERLLTAYSLDIYTQIYPWADYIKPITDKAFTERLDNQLCNLINNNEFDDIWLSAGEILDYNDFSGFKYKQSSGTHYELSLEQFLNEFNYRDEITAQKLKNKKITVHNGAGHQIKNWSAYNCINGEIDLEGETYVLNDGQWYEIETDFYTTINSYFLGMSKSNLNLPDYGGLNEGLYLKYVAQTTDIALLDQKWVRPVGAPNNLEFCDLLSPCNSIIHVKMYGSSAVLNHLFAQAYQSVEMLLNSPEVITQVNEHLENTQLTLDFDPNLRERTYKIVLAIMDNVDREIHMPFFAKVNLRHQSRKIASMGFDVELLKINIGDRVDPREVND